MSLPTANEKLKSTFYNGSFIEIHSGDADYIMEIMIEFARLHVEEALKQASENFKMKFKVDIAELHMNDDWTEVDKSSILNAYPLENIK